MYMYIYIYIYTCMGGQEADLALELIPVALDGDARHEQLAQLGVHLPENPVADLDVYLVMYVYIYIYMFIYTYTYTYMHIYI